MLFPSTNTYDVIVSCFQESKDRNGFIERLNKFMEQNGFRQIKTTHMLEMFIIAFIKKSKQQMLNGVQTNHCAMGKEIIFG